MRWIITNFPCEDVNSYLTVYSFFCFLTTKALLQESPKLHTVRSLGKAPVALLWPTNQNLIKTTPDLQIQGSCTWSPFRPTSSASSSPSAAAASPSSPSQRGNGPYCSASLLAERASETSGRCFWRGSRGPFQEAWTDLYHRHTTAGDSKAALLTNASWVPL